MAVTFLCTSLRLQSAQLTVGYALAAYTQDGHCVTSLVTSLNKFRVHLKTRKVEEAKGTTFIHLRTRLKAVETLVLLGVEVEK